MYAPTDMLWRVNNEYRKRLAQAQTFLDLLEQMILVNSGERQNYLLELLHYAREEVAGIVEDHRIWRHRFYYDSVDNKRMVQTDRAVNQALSRFNRMRSQHENRLNDLYSLFYETPRPDPTLTRVPNGDLWTLAQFAIGDLLGFTDYLTELGQTN